MVHSNTELLIDYWRSRRGGRPVPARADIEPSGFVALAPQVFIAERCAGRDVRFRLAGETIVELHGRPLGGESLLGLWRTDQRGRLAALLGSALMAGEPLVICAESVTAQAFRLRLEVLFAPLSGADGRIDRFLGLYQPTSGFYHGVLEPLELLNMDQSHSASPKTQLRLAALNGRRIA
jgi:hypothetical protein